VNPHNVSQGLKFGNCLPGSYLSYPSWNEQKKKNAAPSSKGAAKPGKTANPRRIVGDSFVADSLLFQ